MKFVLQTERLMLREFLPSEAPNICALNADPEVIHYTGDNAFQSEAAARVFLEGYAHYREFCFGRWAVLSKPHLDFMGWCGLRFADGDVDWEYRLMKQHWQNGYATEAATACLENGFDKLKLQRITGRSD